MTQPEEAVGGASDPVVAAEPTVEDRLSAAFGEQAEEPEKKPEDDPDAPQGEEGDLTAEDLEDDEGGEAGDDQPIAPPTSWTGENKAKFAELPRELQEYVAQRETEREKFVQSKAQEASKTRSEVVQETWAAVQQIRLQQAQVLQGLLPEIPRKPSNQLNVDDPIEYANQMDVYDWAVAQHQQVQQHLSFAQQEAQFALNEQVRLGNEQTGAVLAKEFPEYLDPTEGPKLREKLGSIALEVGYSAEQLAKVDATDILAMRKISDWKAKADKYDTLMAKKMEKVREAKDLPRVSRPGTAQPRGAAANQRYADDRKAMREGSRDAAIRVFSNL